MILDEHLSGIGGIEICQLLREDPGFDTATPIIITASAPAPRAVRASAYRAGAWEFCTQPLDIDTLLLQLSTFLRAKRDIAARRHHTYIDVDTGVLTPEGRAVTEFLQLSRDSFRRSDIVGRTADGRLALLAPETDAHGVEGLLARLRTAMGAPTTDVGPQGAEFRAGYWAVQDFASAPLEPPEFMRRAMRAHDHIKRSPHDHIAIGFDQLPES
jgi:CheY-like chemotaxis protein